MAVVAGMPRSGTTMLHHVFDEHPGVYVPFRKETSYSTFQYGRGRDWYLSLYRKMSSWQLGFDISGNYILLEDSIPRLLDYDPDIKVIVSARDPAAVVVSLFRLMTSWDPTTPPFEEFVERYLYKFGPHRTTFEFASGLLTRNLEKYREAFGDNLLVLDFRMYRENLLEAVAAIERFVGLDGYFNAGNLKNLRINSSGRRNSRFISGILSQDAVTAFIYRHYPETSIFFPDRAARALRKGIDRLRISAPGKSGGPTISPDQLELARRLFADETDYVHGLFTESPMILGSGRPYGAGEAEGGAAASQAAAPSP